MTGRGTIDDASQVTIACRLTGTTPGAVGVIGVRGPQAHAHVLACFTPRGRPQQRLPIDRIRFGRWHGGRELDAIDTAARTGEDVVVVATGPDEVEIHGHGGMAALEAVLKDLTARGVVRVDATGWLAARGVPWLERQALRALERTATARTTQLALDQFQGRIRGALQRLVEDATVGDIAALVRNARSLLKWEAVGKHLSDPWRVAIVGPPNVGKSSLLNRMLGFTRAIVAPVAGTTRDVLRATTAIDGWPVQLLDTAGIRESEDPIEQLAIEQATSARQVADLLLVVVDAQTGPTAEHQPFEKVGNALWVWNKADLSGGETSTGSDRGLASATGRAGLGGWLVSAHTGAGIDQLLRAIGQQLVPSAPEVGRDAVPFDPAITSVVRAVIEAAEAPSAAPARPLVEALEQLRRVLGHAGP
jgi:tRNA modification GTPase